MKQYLWFPHGMVADDVQPSEKYGYVRLSEAKEKISNHQRITDRARAVVASWEQWQAASEADKAVMWRYVEGGIERLREVVDEQDEA